MSGPLTWTANKAHCSFHLFNCFALVDFWIILLTSDSRVWTLKSRLWNLDFRIKTPDSLLHTPDSRLQTPDYNLNHNLQLKNKQGVCNLLSLSGDRVWSLESGVWSLESGVWYLQILNLSLNFCVCVVKHIFFKQKLETIALT